MDKVSGGKLKITVHANTSLFKAIEIKRADPDARAGRHADCGVAAGAGQLNLHAPAERVKATPALSILSTVTNPRNFDSTRMACTTPIAKLVPARPASLHPYMGFDSARCPVVTVTARGKDSSFRAQHPSGRLRQSPATRRSNHHSLAEAKALCRNIHVKHHAFLKPPLCIG